MRKSTSLDAEGRKNLGRTTQVRPCHVTPLDEVEFQKAVEAYKARSGRQFPTWSEILEVLRALGYAKRIWRPVEPEPPAALEAAGRPPLVDGPGFRSMGEDSTTGLLCWYSRVETPIGT